MATMFPYFLRNTMFDFLKNIIYKKSKEDVQQKSVAYKHGALYKRVGYFPKEELIYIKALTHSSYNKKTYEKNERLEFLGDAVLNFVIAEILYEKFEYKNEGQLTRLRSNIVSRKYLNEIGFNLELHVYLKHKLHPQFYKTSPDIVGNTFEALIGAYYVDLGISTVKEIIYKLLIEHVNFDELIAQAKDKKSYLFEWSQVEKKTIRFEHTSADNVPHAFHVKIYINDDYITDGYGKTKKEAELDACTNACSILEV